MSITCGVSNDKSANVKSVGILKLEKLTGTNGILVVNLGNTKNFKFDE